MSELAHGSIGPPTSTTVFELLGFPKVASLTLVCKFLKQVLRTFKEIGATK
jgi:hypothetical protein